MAISAYDREGRLKKNPLLGTSLLSDPGRAEQREQFMSLHGEAKENVGEGRAGMLGKLAGRFKTFGGPEVERLDVIKRRQDKLSSQANDLRLEGIGDAQDRIDALSRAEEIGTSSNYNVSPFSKEGDAWSDPVYREFVDEWRSTPGSGTGEVGGGKTTLMPAKYMQETWLPREMEAAQANYSQAYDAASESYYSQLGILGQQHEALTVEQKQREGKLAETAGLYNMFLGA
jgi:hypothetical protein